jgi:hypothetical protein
VHADTLGTVDQVDARREVAPLIAATGLQNAVVSAPQLEEVEAFLAALDASEDVQTVFAGLQG